MSIWGKLVGGAAGFALGGPLGALIGAAAGHAVDKIAANVVAVEAGDNTKALAFTIAVIALGAKMAKADGTVTRDEVAAFKQVFHVPPEETRNVGRIFNLARRDSQGFEPYARQVASMFADRPEVLEELLACLFHIAKADGEIHDRELEFLRSVGAIFGFDDARFASIRDAEIGPDAADPYHILGVTREADDDAIKAAYRKLIREHHPDRLIAAGMPEEFVGIATERMANVNVAYDKIRRERGLT
ncbi:MAG: TerB family tellurite resistance protein [Inquilinaceae bacterium]